MYPVFHPKNSTKRCKTITYHISKPKLCQIKTQFGVSFKAFDMKKNFCHRPAVIKEEGYRSFILYYQYVGKKLKRFRPTFGINWIQDPKERIKLLRQKKKWLNEEVLPAGYTHLNFPEQVEEGMTVKEGIDYALNVKRDELRANSFTSYESKAKIFLKYCEEHDFLNIEINRFTPFQARQWMRHYDKNVAPKPATYNNTYIRVSILFSLLKNDKMIEDNPFANFKARKVYKEDKQIRKFTSEEDRVVYNYIFQNDDFLFLAVLNLCWTLIRPIEMRRLRIKDFDLKNGKIRMAGSNSKNHTDVKYLTIPPDVLPHYRRILDGYHSHYYVFGKWFKPHARIQCGKNEMNRRHKAVLQKLLKSGQLKNIEGLSFYSWKYTSISKLMKEFLPGEVQELARWKRIETVDNYNEHNANIETGLRIKDHLIQKKE